MEDTYLVEIRLGRTKWKIKQFISSVAGSSGIRQFMEPHPHVTLFGPLVLNAEVSPEQTPRYYRERLWSAPILYRS